MLRCCFGDLRSTQNKLCGSFQNNCNCFFYQHQHKRFKANRFVRRKKQKHPVPDGMHKFTSVLTNEIVSSFNEYSRQEKDQGKPNSPRLFLDCSFGDGGHSLSLIKSMDNVQIIAVDCDKSYMSTKTIKFLTHKHRHTHRFQFVRSHWSNMLDNIYNTTLENGTLTLSEDPDSIRSSNNDKNKDILNEFDGILIDCGLNTGQE